jgi:hypothetical protein
MWYSREKNLSRTRFWSIGKKRKNFNVHLKKPLKIYNKRKLALIGVCILVMKNNVLDSNYSMLLG